MLLRFASETPHNMKLGRLDSIDAFEVKSRATGEVYTLCRSLTEGTGISDFRVMVEELPPSHKTSAPHFHSKKHELYVVMRGSPTAYVNGEAIDLNAGDFIVFEASTGDVHYLQNRTTGTVELLTISSSPSDDVTTYEREKSEELVS